MMRGNVAHIVQAGQPTRHHLFLRDPEDRRNFLSVLLEHAPVEARQMSQLQQLGQRPDRHVIVVLATEVGNELFVRGVPALLDPLEPHHLLAGARATTVGVRRRK